MTSLTRQQFVMDFLWVIDGMDKASLALFSYEEYAEDNPLFLRMRVEDWRDMGEPKKITVTIEPGDRLNDSGT